MIFTTDQTAALDRIFSWLKADGPQTLSLAGLAGTGKSTLLAHVAATVGSGAVVACPTGKAAAVLRRKGIRTAQTIHSAIYMLAGEDKDGNPLFEMKDGEILDGTGLVLLDEASMLQRQVNDDLLSVARRVLYCGDHGQLEPVGDDALVLAEPDCILHEIHRQALDSGIIRFAHQIRSGQPVIKAAEYAEPDVSILPRTYELRRLVGEVDAFLVAFNRTRISLNRMVREERGYAGPFPNVGETVVCLYNQRRRNIWNGETYTVEAVGRDAAEVLYLDLRTDSGRLIEDVPAIKAQFMREKKLPDREVGVERPEYSAFLDYGYALTVHKYQGSESDRICVVDELPPACLWDPNRWRYTAATRAARKLFWKQAV